MRFEKGVMTLRMPSGKAVWDLFVEGFGPTKVVATACDEKRRQELERDFVVCGCDSPRSPPAGS